MSKVELLEALVTGPVMVKFRKKDGTIRDMHCTLNPTYIDEGNTPKSDAKPSWPEYIIRVFDIEKMAWRSFDLDTVIEVDNGID
jgi:hypothetical protein